jgi:penicillin-binding protein 1A
MRKAVRFFWILFFGGLTAFILLIVLIVMGAFGKLPSLHELEHPSLVLASEVYADDGALMGKYYTEKGNRTHVDFNSISPNVIHALVATEDERFYEHSGIDGKAVLRAIGRIGRDGGGSTLTQQLALNMFNGERSHHRISRVIQKLKEWIIAIELERNFTKEEILALYLNDVSFSDNVYGIRNASRTFFQKDPDSLNVQEAATLVGMVNNPRLFNPRTNMKAAMDRRNLVINRMVTNHFLSDEEATLIKQKPIELRYSKLDENNGLAPYFRDVLRSDLKKWCKDHINPATGEPYNLYQDGLKIYTTLDPRMQAYADEAVSQQMPALQRILDEEPGIRNKEIWKDHPNLVEAAIRSSDRWQNGEDQGMSVAAIRNSFYVPVKMKVFAWNAPGHRKDTVMTPLDSIKYHRQMLQAGFMVMDPFTGAIKAWVGGIDFKTYKFDHVNIGTKRQVGSSIKPFLYGLAIEDFNFTPQTTCEAVQQYFPEYNAYVPAHMNAKVSGTRTMADGLAHSTNEVAAYIMKQFGPDGPKRFAEFLKQVGIPTSVQPYPSLALGACELSLYEMMGAYTIFPSNGISTQPYYISRIEDKHGNIIGQFIPSHKEVISQSTAYTMTRMMQGPVDYGTAAGLRQRLGLAEMGGKTGTTNDNSDAWFMGFTPQLMAGTWVGCDERFIRIGSRLGEAGKAARPIWEYFFSKVLADKTFGLDRQARFNRPDSVQTADSGLTDPLAAQTQPGAQGVNQGNGNAGQYIDTSKGKPSNPY